MWSDDLNKKIEEADKSNNPAYNEKGWENMELLLDKHLPLKKKRRWFILLLFPLLLAVTTAIFILQKGDKSKNLIHKQKNIPVQPSTSTDKLIDNDNRIIFPPKIVTNALQQSPVKATTENSLSETRSQNQFIPQYIAGKNGKQYQLRQKYGQPPSFLEKIPVKKTDEVYNDFVRNNPVTPDELSNATNELTNITSTPFATDSFSTKNTIDTAGKKQKDTAQTKADMPVSNPEKEKHASLNKLSLNISFGPDISSVGVNKPGKLKTQFGLGVNFALSNTLNIRTGFFAGYKKYTADSSDYHPTYTINNLQKIDANCFVYEIPLTMVYNFSATKKHSWFISGGLSSYLMKKETYGYYYKNAWGQPQYYKRTYRNENSHLFSVINISGGYHYDISDRFSILTEPYLKIPASGIGVGKVKLNSAGILFTVDFKPFLKSK